MARLIIKNRYIQGGAKNSAHLSYLVKYIATRDGVEKVRVNNANEMQTKPQQELIKSLVRDYPKSKDSFEYLDYKDNPTMENASEFIAEALELFVYPTSDNEKYVEYIAKRPRVELVGTHGLFNGSDEKINLSKVARDISTHKGNVWIPIISLRREDADITDYQTQSAWKSLISSKVFEIAESLKIHPDNFIWYGAFHNESHHPHVHLMCYSKNPNEGYLTRQGIEKMKSSFVNEIFKQELTPLYTMKSQRRDELKKEATKVFKELGEKISTTHFYNPKLEDLIFTLSDKLKVHKGKKQYGYLPKPVKLLVDLAVDELAKEPSIKEAYELWFELQNEIYNFYNDSLPKPLPLSMQKEFKSIKNMLIREVVSLELDEQAGMNKSIYSQSKSGQTWQSPSIGLCITRVLNGLSKIFVDTVPRDSTTMQQRVDSKRLRKLREKKLALGQKVGGQERENIEQRFN